MCLAFLYLNNDPASINRLVLTFNREEFVSRDTIPLSRFAEDSNIIGGRDRRAGGSWLGLN